jgi:hypothetical protein
MEGRFGISSAVHITTDRIMTFPSSTLPLTVLLK